MHVLIVSRESAEVEDSTDAGGRGTAGDRTEHDRESSRSPDIELRMHLLSANLLEPYNMGLRLSS